MLSNQHVEQLFEESGIINASLSGVGVESFSQKESLDEFGVYSSGIGFPYHDMAGNIKGYRLKLDQPLGDVRYSQKKGEDLNFFFVKSDLENLKDPNTKLYITEGEKKALALRQIIHEGVVISIPGCWNWKSAGFSGLPEAWGDIPLSNRDVVYIPDSDFFTNENVWAAGNSFLSALTQKGANVSLIRLCDQKEKMGVDDFLMLKGPDDFFALKPIWQFSHNVNFESKEKFLATLGTLILVERAELPVILKKAAKIHGLDYKELILQINSLKKKWGALKPGNEDKGDSNVIIWDRDTPPDKLFEKMGTSIGKIKGFYEEEATQRILFFDEKFQMISLDDPKIFSSFLGPRIPYKSGTINAKGYFNSLGFELIPVPLASSFLLSKSKYMNLKKVSAFSESPIFTGSEVVYSRGYNEASGFFYTGPHLRPRDTTSHLDKFLDFPFESKIDKVNALGVLLSMAFFRDYLPGAHPSFIIQGNDVNLGKTTLAKAFSSVVGGRLAPISFSKNEDELDKSLGAVLRENYDVILFDNLKASGSISSPLLERAITDSMLNFRLLGQSSRIVRKNNIQFIFTLNEGTFSKDLVTRAVSVFLSSEYKTSSDEPDIEALKKPVLEELLGMMERWIAKGMSEKYVFFPKFPVWARLIGGILHANGFDGFLSNYDETTDKLDPITKGIYEVVDAELYDSGKNLTGAHPASEWRNKLESYDQSIFRDNKNSRSKDTKVGGILKKLEKKSLENPVTSVTSNIQIFSEKNLRGGGTNKKYFFKKSEGQIHEKGRDLEENRNLNVTSEKEGYGEISTYNQDISINTVTSLPIIKDSYINIKNTNSNKEEVNIISIENCIEMRLQGNEVTVIPNDSWQLPLSSTSQTYDLNGELIPSVLWRLEDGKIGEVFSFDVETELKVEGVHPRIALASAFNGNMLFFILPRDLADFYKVNSSSKWIAHNAAFDFAVFGAHLQNEALPFEMTESGNIGDTLILARLLALASHGGKKFTLDKLVKNHLRIDLPKEAEVNGKKVRTSYADFLENITEAPAAYFHYNAFDTIATLKLWEVLRNMAEQKAIVHKVDPLLLLSHDIQLKTAFAAGATSHYGFALDTDKVNVNIQTLKKRLSWLESKIKRFGFFNGKGSEERFQIIMLKLEVKHKVKFPRLHHKSGKVLVSRAAEELESFTGIRFIRLFLERESLNKTLSTFVRHLEGKEVVHPWIDILKSTGRVSMRKPNLQQIPRSASVDLRGQFIARPGKKLVIADYSSAELVSLSQSCIDLFGFSHMGDAINRSEDLHKLVASKFYGKTDITKEERQLGKVINFGQPGGLGLKALVSFAKASYGVDLTEEEGAALRDAWFTSFPEMKKYLARADQFRESLVLVDHPTGMKNEYACHIFTGVCEGRTGTKSGREYTEKETQWADENLELLRHKYPHLPTEKGPELSKALYTLLTATIPRTGRVRARCSPNAYLNNSFQGLLADISNSAWFKLSHIGISQGFRVVNAIHDELVIECDELKAEEVKKVVEDTMIDVANSFCPNVRMGVDAKITDKWEK